MIGSAIGEPFLIARDGLVSRERNVRVPASATAQRCVAKALSAVRITTEKPVSNSPL